MDDDLLITPAQLAVIERIDTSMQLFVVVGFVVFLVLGVALVRLLRSQ